MGKISSIWNGMKVSIKMDSKNSGMPPNSGEPCNVNGNSNHYEWL